MLRKILAIAPWLALAALLWVVQGFVRALDGRQLLLLFVGWTAAGLIGAGWYVILRQGEKLERLRDQTIEASKKLAAEVDSLSIGRVRQAEAIQALARAGSKNATRVDALERKNKQIVTAVQAHQLTLDVVSLAMNVQTPKPGEKPASC